MPQVGRYYNISISKHFVLLQHSLVAYFLFKNPQIYIFIELHKVIHQKI